MSAGWDPACEDLAEHFLDDHQLLAKHGPAQLDVMRRQLAQHIQDAVEDWFAGQEGDD